MLFDESINRSYADDEDGRKVMMGWVKVNKKISKAIFAITSASHRGGGAKEQTYVSFCSKNNNINQISRLTFHRNEVYIWRMCCQNLPPPSVVMPASATPPLHQSLFDANQNVLVELKQARRKAKTKTSEQQKRHNRTFSFDLSFIFRIDFRKYSMVLDFKMPEKKEEYLQQSSGLNNLDR